jgi:glycosyltransferase involved in cell wall biosynthesis
MRVLLIHNYYQHFGGEDMAAEADFRLLSGRGVEVRKYCRHNDEIKLYGIGEKAAFPLRTISSGRTVAEVESILREFPADVAYLHNLYPLISPSIYVALHRKGVPIVQVLHDYRPFCANGWLYTNGAICDRCAGGHHWQAVINRCMHGSIAISAIYGAALWNLRRSKVLDRIGLFVCPSEFCRLQAIRNGIDAARIIVRPHSVGIESASDAVGAPGSGLQSHDPYFLYLGRLSREKGLLTLLAAFERLPDIALRIAGSGPLEPELQRRLTERPMPNVQMLGFQTGAAKAELLRNARAIIMPSECFETFGITVLEAYAVRRPVIASDAGALPYLVEDGITGCVFERANPAALCERVAALMADEAAADRMGYAGWRLAKQKYGNHVAADALISILERAIAGESSHRHEQFRHEQENALQRG